MPKCRICDKQLPPDVALCPSCGAPTPAANVTTSPDAVATSETSDSDLAAPADLDPDLHKELVTLLQTGHKLRAVKLYRERLGCSLAEAKVAVEALAPPKTTKEGSGSGCATALLLLVALVAGLSLLAT